MSHVSYAWLAGAALLLSSAAPAAAERIELDLRAAMERAQRAAPDAIAARAHVREAEAVLGGSVFLESNPAIEGGAGPRLTAGRPIGAGEPERAGRAIDAEVRIEQALEPGRRGARRGVARAEVGHARAEADVALRELERAVSLAYYDALHAQRAGELAEHAEGLARRVAEAAERRRKAGDVTDLDLNLARIAAGRARAEVQAAAVERIEAVGRLAVLVGAAGGDVIVLRGELRPPPPAQGTAEARPDVRALDRERELARAEERRAAASGYPELGVWGSYQREDEATIVLGGMRLTLPLFNRGQGDRAAARAKEQRARDTRDAVVRVAGRQLADASAAYAGALQAADAYERDVVPLLDDSERLLDKTIAAGQIAIRDYLVARQELLDGRRTHLARLLALANAAVAARYAAGGGS
jgi:outer membrane protein, heavy metal efflux system